MMKITTNQIKTLATTIVAAMMFTACNQTDKDGYQTAESFVKLKKELINEFGKDAYYTDFAVVNNDNGVVVSVTQTKNPSSLKMEEWTSLNGDWTQNSEVTLEVSGDAKAEDFMFQLDKIMNLELLGKLVEQSKQKVITEKKIQEVKVETVSMNAPDDGNFNNAKYFITVKPKQGGTTFNFWYNLDGTLDKFDY